MIFDMQTLASSISEQSDKRLFHLCLLHHFGFNELLWPNYSTDFEFLSFTQKYDDRWHFDIFVYLFFLFFFKAAINALKRKKRLEKQLKQIDGTLSMIEMQREALEGAKSNASTITTMKQASEAMKAVQKDLYVHKWTVNALRTRWHIYENFYYFQGYW